MVTRIIGRFVAILLTFALATSCTTRTIDLERYFAANAEELQKLNTLLLKHPLILSVEPNLPLKLVQGSGKFDRETTNAYDKALNLVRALGIKFVTISRDRHQADTPLVAIRYVLDSTGIVTSGGTITGISFVPDAAVVEKLNTGNDTYTTLPGKGWYAYRLVDTD